MSSQRVPIINHEWRGEEGAMWQGNRLTIYDSLYYSLSFLFRLSQLLYGRESAGLCSVEPTHRYALSTVRMATSAVCLGTYRLPRYIPYLQRVQAWEGTSGGANEVNGNFMTRQLRSSLRVSSVQLWSVGFVHSPHHTTYVRICSYRCVHVRFMAFLLWSLVSMSD